MILLPLIIFILAAILASVALIAFFIWTTRCAPSPPTAHLSLAVVAHRGESAGAPENTLRAIALAASNGAKAVEFDVGMTKDGALVLMHDATVDRTTSGSGKLANLTLEQVKALQIPDTFRPELGPERVPTLEEALRLVAQLGLHADIEIKEDIDTARFLTELDRLIPELKLAKSVWISSFYPQYLYTLRRQRPSLITALNVEQRATRNPVINALLLGTWLPRFIGVGIIKPAKALVTPDYIATWTRHKIPVLTWTVNTAHEKAHLNALGANIITDCTQGGCPPR